MANVAVVGSQWGDEGKGANLLIAENAPLILPLHGELDRLREAARGDRKIGTTGRALGPHVPTGSPIAASPKNTHALRKT